MAKETKLQLEIGTSFSLLSSVIPSYRSNSRANYGMSSMKSSAGQQISQGRLSRKVDSSADWWWHGANLRLGWWQRSRDSFCSL